MRRAATACTLALAVVLAGCGERQQELRHASDDTAAFQGTGMPYAVPGWKAGDKVSWEQQLKTRTQQGQNDYVKAN